MDSEKSTENILLRQESTDNFEHEDQNIIGKLNCDTGDTPSRQTNCSDGYQTDASLSPSIPFISAVQSPCSSLPPVQQSPTPSLEWQDAQSDILSDKDNTDDVDGDLVTKYPLVNYGVTKRRLSRAKSSSQRSKRGPNLEDIEFPSLDYGPHLRFFPEEDCK